MALNKLSKDVIKDINSTICELRKKDLLLDENGTKQSSIAGNQVEITFSGKSEANSILFDKHISSNQVIDALLKERQYSILLYDKGIIQAEFILGQESIMKERLIFIKKHNRILSQEEINDSEENDFDWFNDEDGIPIFIRVDYDQFEFKEVTHPAAHLTISNHESCRIPMKKALSFSEFVRFIIYTFYSELIDAPQYVIPGEDTVSESEKKMIHLNWEQ